MVLLVKYDNLPKISAKWRDEIARLAQETAEAIRDEAAADAPVISGALSRSIIAEQRSDHIRLQWVVKVDSRLEDVDYGHYVEYGTIYQSARPFLIPAFERHQAMFVENVAAILAGITPRRVA